MATAVEGLARRRLGWEACLNVRDVGGYPTRDGGQTRWGGLVRADTLSQLTPAGQAALLAYGVRTIIDVRFPSEVARATHPFGPLAEGPLAAGSRADNSLDEVASTPRTDEAVRPAYLNIPVNTGRDPALDAQVWAAFEKCRTRAQGYCVDLDFNGVGLTTIVVAFARAAAGGVLVHCHAGKDRTGIVVALLLSVAGVPDEVIADDYALTGVCMAPVYERLLAEVPEDDVERRARLEQEMSTRPETMLTMLAHVRERYGGAEAYLLAGGATKGDLALVRRRLVEAPIPIAASGDRPG